MHSPEGLLDLHQRGHSSLEKLLAHCGSFEAEQLNREIAGFGYPSVRLQLIHAIGAEAYWIGVLEGRMDTEDRNGSLLTLDSVAAWRASVASGTDAYLRMATLAELNSPRRMKTFGGKEVDLVPARVFLRTFTHLYHHQGQVVAMCRLLGKPASGMDFQLD